MRQFLNITQALSDESRIRVLLALRDGELCVCQIIELLGLAPSTVSKHMTLLAQAELVQRRKEGRWHYYQLADAKQGSPVAESLKWLETMMGDSPIARQDQKSLKQICRKSKEEVSSCCYRD